MTISRSTLRVLEFVVLCVIATVAVGAARGSVPLWMWIGLGLFTVGVVALVVDDNRRR